ncbi:hypothetical protein Bca4012_082666 [Brassica carinata]
MAGGRNRLRNRGRGTSYGSTFLGTPENVPDSQIPSVPQAVDHAAEEGAPPTLARLYKLTHQHADGTFSHPRAEALQRCRGSDSRGRDSADARKSGRCTVQLSAIEQDRIFEQVAPKKRGRIPGIGV